MRGKRKKKTLECCSRSCNMKHLTKTKKIKTKNRSKPELMLCNAIIAEFSNIELHISDRTTLESGLELDIYIPERSLAIEVNGITHYEPIYGQEKLDRTRRNDKAKREEAKTMGITVLTVDIHTTRSSSMEAFVLEWYRDKLRPILLDKGA